MRRLKILVAPNSFKNSLPASDVAEAMKLGLHQSDLNCSIRLLPVGDGGDGTGILLCDFFKASIIKTVVLDALGRKIKTSFGFNKNNKTAIIELANASGLKLLQPFEYNVMAANTFGTGQLIKQALAAGAKKIIICIGGSATIDGGAGILKALGAFFFDAEENEIESLPLFLNKLNRIDLSGLDKRIFYTEIIVLCDVENKLLGEEGAAKIFGPQKGASSQNIVQLEKCLHKLKDVIFKETGNDVSIIKHGGAAGGVAGTLNVLLKASLVNGIEYFLQVTGFETALQECDVVITGEGCIDTQTLHGKAPFGVAKKAKEYNKYVIGVGGQIIFSQEMEKYFDLLRGINEYETEIKTAIKNTRNNIIACMYKLGNTLAVKSFLKTE